MSCCTESETKDDILRRKLAEVGIAQDPPRYQRPPHPPTDVYLNVYDLVDPKRNRIAMKLGFGIFHTGVEIHGTEWSFGETEDPGRDGTGVFCVTPQTALPFVRRRIRLGTTCLSVHNVDVILMRMEVEWKSKDYHILNNNCNHFASYFCKTLSTTEPLIVPKWANRAARWAGTVVPRRLSLWVIRKYDHEEPPNGAHEADAADGFNDSVIPPPGSSAPDTHLSAKPPNAVPTPEKYKMPGSTPATPCLVDVEVQGSKSDYNNFTKDSKRIDSAEELPCPPPAMTISITPIAPIPPDTSAAAVETETSQEAMADRSGTPDMRSGTQSPTRIENISVQSSPRVEPEDDVLDGASIHIEVGMNDAVEHRGKSPPQSPPQLARSELPTEHSSEMSSMRSETYRAKRPATKHVDTLYSPVEGIELHVDEDTEVEAQAD